MVYRRESGDDSKGRQVIRELVVGVDVGSQGTCAQAIAPDGERVAEATPRCRTLSYPQPGWAEQDAREWLGAVAQALAEVQQAADGTFRAVAFGSQLDGLVAADAGEERQSGRADLDGSARNRTV